MATYTIEINFEVSERKLLGIVSDIHKALANADDAYVHVMDEDDNTIYEE